MYIVLMTILADANIFLSVLLNEPEKEKIINLTKEAELVSPEILPYEVGNALSSLYKRNRLNLEKVRKCYQAFLTIPVRLVPSEIVRSLEIAAKFKIYAYDAYYLETALRLKLKILTLDRRMMDIASELNIRALEEI